MAIAKEQEMKASVQEMRARGGGGGGRCAQGPSRCIAAGQVGGTDYMNYKNIGADTQMRHSIPRLEKDETREGREIIVKVFTGRKGI